MECYLEGCSKEALKEDRCFAYCSIEHKAKVVMVDFDLSVPNRPRNLKELQLKLQQMKQEYLRGKNK